VFRKVLDEVFNRDLDVTVFSKNRGRLLRGEVARVFFRQVLKRARQGDLLSDEHFTVDRTLIEGSAGQKSFQEKDRPTPPVPEAPGNATVDFQGKRLSNQTPGPRPNPRLRTYEFVAIIFRICVDAGRAFLYIA
jgi:hypothetical protein